MKKKTTLLKVKGINTPRLLIWVRGYYHGKIIHTGGLDEETDTIISGYITGQIKRFRNACVNRCLKAENALGESWTTADELIIDYYTTITDTEHGNSKSYDGEDTNQARKRESQKKALQSILKKLSIIANDIRKEYDMSYSQMEATAELLLSTFSCYGHGVLMKPISEKNLPCIPYKDCAQEILSKHEDTWNAINAILKEAKG